MALFHSQTRRHMINGNNCWHFNIYEQDKELRAFGDFFAPYKAKIYKKNHQFVRINLLEQ